MPKPRATKWRLKAEARRRAEAERIAKPRRRGASQSPVRTDAAVVARTETARSAAACSGSSPSSRIRGFFGSAPIADQWVGRKGLHYKSWLGTFAVAIRGGGCGGNWSLSCWIRSLSSGSGWVHLWSHRASTAVSYLLKS